MYMRLLIVLNKIPITEAPFSQVLAIAIARLCVRVWACTYRSERYTGTAPVVEVEIIFNTSDNS